MTEATRLSNDPPPEDMVRVLHAATDALTDGMVERVSTTGANALEVLDRLNDPATRDAVMVFIDRITEMHQAGVMESTFQTLQTIHGARSAMTDGMIERLAMTGENAMALADRVNDPGVHEALTSAVDQVADLHKAGVMDSAFQALQMVHGARSAMTDGMIERFSQTAETMLGIVDHLNQPDTVEAVHTLIDDFTALHKSGALKTAVEAVGAIHAAKAAMNDSMVERLFAFVEYMMNTVANEELATLAHETRLALEEAVMESRETKPSGGVMGLLKMVTKPETQATIQFLLSMGQKLREHEKAFATLPATCEAPKG